MKLLEAQVIMLHYATIRRIWDQAKDSLTDEEVDGLYEKLKELTNVDEATKTAHIQSIKERYYTSKGEVAPKQTSEEAKDIKSTIETKKVCPRCGKELVLRTARKGEHAGEQFYGCSGFPKCRYSESIGN